MKFIQMNWVTTGSLNHQDSCADHIISVFCGSFPQTSDSEKTPLCPAPHPKERPKKKWRLSFRSIYPSHMEETGKKHFFRGFEGGPGMSFVLTKCMTIQLADLTRRASQHLMPQSIWSSGDASAKKKKYLKRINLPPPKLT